MQLITYSLILTFALCLCGAVLNFRGILTENKLGQNSTNAKPALILLVFGVLSFLFVLFNSILIKDTETNLYGVYLSIGSAIACIGFVYLCAALLYQWRAVCQTDESHNKSSHPFTTGILLLLAAITSLGLFARATPFSLDQYGIGLYVHLICSLTAYALFSIAALFTLLQVWESRRIRKALPENYFLPSLEFLEKESFRWITLGFVLLTIALLTGFFFLYDLRGQHLPHKVVLSLLSWVVFGILIIGRYKLGWRGKTALRWTLAGFILLVLAYFGSKLVLEVFLGRSWN